MKIFFFLFILGFRLFANAVQTLDGCVNAACEYVEDLAATCQDQAAGTVNGTDCLCTERFKVNLSRCLSGFTCAWDGNGSPTPPICSDIYCPGSFDQSFIDECPGVSTSGLPIPSTTTGSPGQTSPTSTNGNSNLVSQTVTGTATITRTGTSGAFPSGSSTTSASHASAIQVPIRLAGIIVISSLLSV